jgi:hypothetical protein
LLSFYLLEVRGVVYDEWQIEGMPLVVFGCWFGIGKGFEYGLGCVAF